MLRIKIGIGYPAFDVVGKTLGVQSEANSIITDKKICRIHLKDIIFESHICIVRIFSVSQYIYQKEYIYIKSKWISKFSFWQFASILATACVYCTSTGLVKVPRAITL